MLLGSLLLKRNRESQPEISTHASYAGGPDLEPSVPTEVCLHFSELLRMNARLVS
jgi:hypothetical protein